MKFKTTLERRIEQQTKKKPTGKLSKVLVAVSVVAETIFNTLLPFMFGYFFATTQNIWMFILFLLLLFFNIKIEHIGDDIKIRIIRGL